jgi:hypothetical protein
MATKAPITNAWISHSGNGRPVPLGTKLDILHFNGDVTRGFVAGSGMTFDVDGAVIAPSRARWSGWDYHDGGPMAPKFKAYRLFVNNERRERNATMFRSWLKVRQKEHAPCVIEDALGGALENAQRSVIAEDANHMEGCGHA